MAASSPLARIATRFGADRLVRAVLGGIGVILMMHRVRPAGWLADPGMSVTPERLLWLIAHLRANGYEIVTLDDALSRMRSPRGRPFACLTFDDGYRDNHAFLWPLLRREAVPATIYLTTGYVSGAVLPLSMRLEALVADCDRIEIGERCFPAGTPEEKDSAYAALLARLSAFPAGDREQVLRGWAAAQLRDAARYGRQIFLDWDAAREMAAGGLVGFGAHTVSHPRLSLLSEGEAFHEIAESRHCIESRLGAAPRHFAFPFGKGGDAGCRERNLAAKAGFASAVYAFGGPVRREADAMALPRIAFSDRDSEAGFRLRLSGATRMFPGKNG